MCPPRSKLSFLLRNHIKVFGFQTRPLCWFACRWVGCSFLLRNLIKIFWFQARPLYWVACRPRVCCSFGLFGFTSRSSGSTPGLRCWVTFRFLLRNRIKVFRFHSRRLSWGRVVDRWAVFSFRVSNHIKVFRLQGRRLCWICCCWVSPRLKWGTRLKFGSRKVRDKSLDAEFIHIGVSDRSFSFRVKWLLPVNWVLG